MWLDGLEISQFTYFQQVGGFDCKPVSGELTYGLERIAMYLQDVDDVYDLDYGGGLKYGDLYKRAEWEWSTYNFEEAPVDEHFAAFDHLEAEVKRLVQRGATEQKNKKGKVRLVIDPEQSLVLPAYDCLIKAVPPLQRARRPRRHRRDGAPALHRPGARPRPHGRRRVPEAARGARLPAAEARRRSRPVACARSASYVESPPSASALR